MYATQTSPAGYSSRIGSSSMVQASGQAVAATPAVDLTPHQMMVRSDLVSYFALGGALLGLAVGIMNRK
jgi:hypothetical protein